MSPEMSLTISNYLAGKIRIEPTEIRAIGGPEYPRLIVPITLDLNPITSLQGEEQHFIIMNVKQCNLCLKESHLKISDGMSYLEPCKVQKPVDWITANLEFPLDLYRIEKIEERRKGNLKFTLDICFLIGFYEPILLQRGNSTITKEFLTDFKTFSVKFDLELPQSHWAETVLPGLGYGQVKIVEVPVPEEIIAKEFSKSLEEFVHAQNYFNKGDYDKTVEHCRSAIEPIKSKIQKFKELIKSNREYDWLKEISVETFDWLDKIYKKTRDLTSKVHHLPSVGHFDRHNAQVIMLFTTALVAYVGRLLSSKER